MYLHFAFGLQLFFKIILNRSEGNHNLYFIFIFIAFYFFLYLYFIYIALKL